MKVGFVLIADYTAFTQDAASVAQVGEQRDQWDDRAARLMLRGTMGKASYLIAGEYKGFETDPETTWQMTDVSVTRAPRRSADPGSPSARRKRRSPTRWWATRRTCRPRSACSARSSCRATSAPKLSQVIGKDHRMTAAVGVFNDWWMNDDALSTTAAPTSRRASRGWCGTPATARTSCISALAGRHAGADHDTMRFKGRPESNVADNYVDTGNLAGDHSRNLGFESAAQRGPVLGAGGVHARVGRCAHVRRSDVPRLLRRRQLGADRRDAPLRPHGGLRPPRDARRAGGVRPNWSCASRTSIWTTASVQGGTFDKTYVGLNWWATRRWKFGAGWGHTWLDRFATTGKTDSFHTRFQLVY